MIPVVILRSFACHSPAPMKLQPTATTAEIKVPIFAGSSFNLDQDPWMPRCENEGRSQTSEYEGMRGLVDCSQSGRLTFDAMLTHLPMSPWYCRTIRDSDCVQIHDPHAVLALLAYGTDLNFCNVSTVHKTRRFRCIIPYNLMAKLYSLRSHVKSTLCCH